MKLTGTLIKGTKITKQAFFEIRNDKIQYRVLLEECFIGLCKELDIPVPIWMKKNTHEFVVFKKTFFTNEQFNEKVKFDRFEIQAQNIS